jgi:hypothetical protein
MSGIQARAAATLDGNPVVVGFPLGAGGELGGGGCEGLTGSGITTLRGTVGPLVKATQSTTQGSPALFAFAAPVRPIRLSGPIDRRKATH